MTCLVANNAYGTLVVSLDAADLTITLSEGEGSRFPSPVIDDEYFLVTVFDLQGQMEICKCTARDGDVLTVVRAQEGTTALSFAVGARVEHRFTAGMYTGLRDDVLGLIANKQNILTFDTTPTAGSVNPVTSGGIREAIDRASEVSGVAIFTGNGTFTVPPGVRVIVAYLCGGSGGGASGYGW